MFDIIFCALMHPLVGQEARERSFIVISKWNAAKSHEGQPSSIFFFSIDFSPCNLFKMLMAFK